MERVTFRSTKGFVGLARFFRMLFPEYYYDDYRNADWVKELNDRRNELCRKEKY